MTGSRSGRAGSIGREFIPCFLIKCRDAISPTAFRSRGRTDTPKEYSFQPFQREMGLLSEDFVGTAQPLKLFREYLDNAPAHDPLGRVLYLDSKTYLPGDILTKVDRMSMLTSLEARVPMLDHVFIEWVTALTPRVEDARWKSEIYSAKAGGTGRGAEGSPLSTEAGFRLAARSLDEKRTERHDPHRDARSRDLAARIFQSGGYPAITGRTLSGTPRPFRPHLALVYVRAVARKFLETFQSRGFSSTGSRHTRRQNRMSGSTDQATGVEEPSSTKQPHSRVCAPNQSGGTARRIPDDGQF